MNRLKATHTLAQMEVSREAYAEIRAKLVEAAYEHAIHEDIGLDMTGISLVPAPQAEAKPPPKFSSNVATQLNMILQKQALDLAKNHITPNIAPDTCFVLFLITPSPRGHAAYIANCDRSVVNNILAQHLDMQDENADAASLRKLLEGAGTLISAIAEAAGWPEGEAVDPMALVELIGKQRQGAKR